MDIYHQIIEKNREVHDIEAPFYDFIHGEIFNWYEQKRSRSSLEQAIGLCPGKTALDIGCGTGNVTIKLIEKGFNVTAVDLSKSMLEILSSKIRDKDHNVKIILGDIDEIIPSLDHFDLVAISSVLHHLPHYLNTMAEISALLKTNGVLYITHEPTGIRPTSNILFRPFRIFDWLLWTLSLKTKRIQLPRIDYSISDYHVSHGFNQNNIIEYLKENGYSIISIEFYTANAKNGFISYFENVLLNSKTHFGVIAQKGNKQPA